VDMMGLHDLLTTRLAEAAGLSGRSA